MVKAFAAMGVALLLAACSGPADSARQTAGAPNPSPSPAVCDLAPSQQSIADHYHCQRRGQGRD